MPSPGVYILSTTSPKTIYMLDPFTTLQLALYDSMTNAQITSGITWSSLNEAIATIDENGLVTSMDLGSATITAFANGYSASYPIIIASSFVSTVELTDSTDIANTVSVLNGGQISSISSLLSSLPSDSILQSAAQADTDSIYQVTLGTTPLFMGLQISDALTSNTSDNVMLQWVQPSEQVQMEMDSKLAIMLKENYSAGTSTITSVEVSVTAINSSSARINSDVNNSVTYSRVRIKLPRYRYIQVQHNGSAIGNIDTNGKSLLQEYGITGDIKYSIYALEPASMTIDYFGPFSSNMFTLSDTAPVAFAASASVNQTTGNITVSWNEDKNVTISVNDGTIVGIACTDPAAAAAYASMNEALFLSYIVLTNKTGTELTGYVALNNGQYYDFAPNTSYTLNVANEMQSLSSTPTLLQTLTITGSSSGGSGSGGSGSGGSGSSGGGSSGNVPCFPTGTRILTAEGYKAVETIKTGDVVITADGRSVKATVYSHKIKAATAETAPYCIPANTFVNQPNELRLSPLHAIQTQRGVWQIPEFAAKKNAAIIQYGLGEKVTYYHIETANYFTDNLVAEGAVVESFMGKAIKSLPSGTPVYTYNSKLSGFTRYNPNKQQIKKL